MTQIYHVRAAEVVQMCKVAYQEVRMGTKLPSLEQRSKQRVDQDRLIAELRARPAKTDNADRRRFEASRKNVRKGR